MAVFELSHGAQRATMPHHVTTRTGPRGLTGWQDVCTLNAIRPGRARPLLFNGTEIALFRDGDLIYALGGVCPNRSAPLGGGTVVDGKAVCPLHLCEFDLRTGISPYDPQQRVAVYRARVVAGSVQINANSVPAGPGRPNTYLGRWARLGATDRGMSLVHHLASGGSPAVTPMGSSRLDAESAHSRTVGYHDLVFKPAQLARPPLSHNDTVETITVIGSRAAKPLTLAIPLMVSHMSYGALSIEAKVALARGAREVGTAIGSGDGGVHGRERDAADKYIVELTPAFPGRAHDAVDEADAIEIKIGEGGRPGLGGFLPGVNVTTEVGLHLDTQPGLDVNTPAHFIELPSLDAIRRRIDELRERSGGVPIGVKIAAGNIEADMAAAIEVGADYITVDGLGAGTAGSPAHVKDHVGLPSITAIHRARRWLDSNGVTDVQLVASGGFRTPDEMAKALALGADAISIGTAALLAIGCQQYRACSQGTCPVGIATQESELRLRLNPDISGHRLATFLRAATTMITDYCRITGRRSVAELGRADLSALTADAAMVTDLPYLG